MATNTISRYQPQQGLTRLPDLVDRLFQESFVRPTVLDSLAGGTAYPTAPVNLYETADSYMLQMALPGIDTDTLDIQVMDRQVSVKGRFEIPTPEQQGAWIWRGLSDRDFFESYTLPVQVEADKTEATYDHGILTLTLPKADHARPKSVKVTASK